MFPEKKRTVDGRIPVLLCDKGPKCKGSDKGCDGPCGSGKRWRNWGPKRFKEVYGREPV